MSCPMLPSARSHRGVNRAAFWGGGSEQGLARVDALPSSSVGGPKALEASCLASSLMLPPPVSQVRKPQGLPLPLSC